MYAIHSNQSDLPGISRDIQFRNREHAISTRCALITLTYLLETITALKAIALDLCLCTDRVTKTAQCARGGGQARKLQEIPSRGIRVGLH